MTAVKYIYDLPFIPYSKVCELLNQNDQWAELAGTHMECDVLEIEKMRKEKNPANELLKMWGQYNHTLHELFILLSRMKNYKAMRHLQNFVEEIYHPLIPDGEEVNEEPPQEKKKFWDNIDQKVKNYLESPHGKKRFNRSPILGANSNSILIASLEAMHLELPNIPNVYFDELTTCTDNWNDKNILGRGGFGTVYRGTWKHTEVAVKRIECRRLESDECFAIQLEQSCTEIKILNSRAHDNILPIYAYSLGGKFPCLVYQFLPNGSLDDRLRCRNGTPPLSWVRRFEIAKGIARGLQFLHTIGDRPLIHGDIKPGNVLLDKNFDPKLGDFGLAREGLRQKSMTVSRIQGTKPYLPPEFLRESKLSTKVDTYSYGVVLFEMATNLSVYDNKRNELKFLRDYVETWPEHTFFKYIDKTAGDEYKTEIFQNFIILGKLCTGKTPESRPEMDHVYMVLSRCN